MPDASRTPYGDPAFKADVDFLVQSTKTLELAPMQRAAAKTSPPTAGAPAEPRKAQR